MLPLVLLLVVGLIEFGKGFNYWISLNHISSETARWAAVDKLPPTNAAPSGTQIRQYAVDQVVTEELKDTVAPDGRPRPTSLSASRRRTGRHRRSATRRPSPCKAPYSFPLVSSVVNFTASLFGGSGNGIGDMMLTGTSTVRLEQLPSDTAGWTQCS